MIDFAEKHSKGHSYEGFLKQYGTDEQRRRWGQVHQRTPLSDQQRQVLADFNREMLVLCVAGAWCGDCVEQCPIFDHFASATTTIKLRFVDRDEDDDLKNELAICGGARVPVVVFLNEDGQHVSRYGDRTLAKYRQMATAQLGAACPSGVVPPDDDLLQAVVGEWLNEFQRVQLLLRLSPRLREKHGD